MFKTVNALVLREVRYKEADRILTLLTDTDGKLTAKARGALRKSSRTAAATQQLTYAEMTLFGNRGRWTVNEATVKEPFTGLREEMECLALGAYFAECMEAFGVEDQPEPALLQLGLNCLYALSRGLYPPAHIKAAFELRLMCLSGYAPELSACASGMGERAELGADALAAMRYITSAPARQILRFSLGDDALLRLSDAAERYLLRRAERGFATLDYWKNITSIQ